jgi:dethiobiotin synthetase
MEGIFVAGTDTGVGKTTISAGLLKMLYGTKSVHYWKPIQTGTIVGDDTKDIQRATELPADIFWEPCYRFAEPLAPAHAAKKWNKTIDMAEIVSAFRSKHSKDDFLIVEGAGGVLVPINSNTLQIDLMKALGLPILIVGEDRVGTINHTLLTLRACRDAGVHVVGVVLTKSVENYGNKESIEQFGQVEVLSQLAPWEDSKTLIAQVGGDPRLRKLFSLPAMPG